MTLMYYLWLIPHPNKYKELAQLIIQLGQKYDGPPFSPHITLLADIEDEQNLVMAKCAELATKINAFTVNVDSIEFQDAYYRSLYLQLVKPKPLLKARRLAEELFSQAPTDAYMPHISLMYGNQSISTKQHIIATLKDHISHELLIDRMELIFADGAPDTWKLISTEHL